MVKLLSQVSVKVAYNGWRYPLVGETRQRRFDGTDLKPGKLPENAPTPTTTPALHQTQCGASVAPLLVRGSGARCVGRIQSKRF
jgi:hypothetical protein